MCIIFMEQVNKGAYMSVDDVFRQCSPEQAKVFREHLDSGWELHMFEPDGEIELHNGGSKRWIKPDGSCYP